MLKRDAGAWTGGLKMDCVSEERGGGFNCDLQDASVKAGKRRWTVDLGGLFGLMEIARLWRLLSGCQPGKAKERTVIIRGKRESVCAW